MLAHMKKHHTDKAVFFVVCPISNADSVKNYLEDQDCICIVDDVQEYVNTAGFFAGRTPANMLIGARAKEGVTQVQLSEFTGIPRRHISDMENGRRPIGKQNAKKIGEVLNINYRLFL